MRILKPIWSLLIVALLTSVTARGADAPKLQLEKGDRIILIGNTLAERMQYFGNWETLLHSRFPTLDLVVHNLGWSADEPYLRPRSQGFQDHGHTLEDEKPDVIIAFFGFNESFAGPAGIDKFKTTLDKFLKDTLVAKYNGKSAPRIALISPIAHEDLGDPDKPDGKANNVNIALYTKAMADVAAKYNVVFVNLFTPTMALMADEPKPLTINGIHLNELGDERVGALLDKALFGPRPNSIKTDLAKLKDEINEKNLQFWYDYRAVNGCYIYGGRKAPFGIVNFPAEFAKLRKMIENREKRVWAVAKGESVPSKIDDSDTGELARVESNVKKEVVLTSPEEAIKTFKLPEGYEINLYASEVEFPDLKKPVQMAIDAKGRLWITTMPSYPMYLPG